MASGNLVEQTCRVRMTPTEWGPATFFHWDELDSFMGRSGDADLRESFELYQRSEFCGKPATNYVDYGEDRVWMCAEHHGMCTQFQEDRPVAFLPDKGSGT